MPITETEKERRKNYVRNYVKQRTVKCYPPPQELKFIRGMQQQTGMGESEAACFLIRVGKEALMKKGINY
jgi:hypothetical protein